MGGGGEGCGVEREKDREREGERTPPHPAHKYPSQSALLASGWEGYGWVFRGLGCGVWGVGLWGLGLGFTVQGLQIGINVYGFLVKVDASSTCKIRGIRIRLQGLRWPLSSVLGTHKIVTARLWP